MKTPFEVYDLLMERINKVSSISNPNNKKQYLHEIVLDIEQALFQDQIDGYLYEDLIDEVELASESR